MLYFWLFMSGWAFFFIIYNAIGLINGAGPVLVWLLGLFVQCICLPIFILNAIKESKKL